MFRIYFRNLFWFFRDLNGKGLSRKSSPFQKIQLACKPGFVTCISKSSIIYLSDLPPGLPAIQLVENEQFLKAGIFGLAARKLNGSGCYHPDR